MTGRDEVNVKEKWMCILRQNRATCLTHSMYTQNLCRHISCWMFDRCNSLIIYNIKYISDDRRACFNLHHIYTQLVSMSGTSWNSKENIAGPNKTPNKHLYSPASEPCSKLGVSLAATSSSLTILEIILAKHIDRRSISIWRTARANLLKCTRACPSKSLIKINHIYAPHTAISSTSR